MTEQTYTAEQYEKAARLNTTVINPGCEDELRVKDMLRQAAKMMRERESSPYSLSEALNVIEQWGQRGNTLDGDDVDRFRALADRIAPRELGQAMSTGGTCGQSVDRNGIMSSSPYGYVYGNHFWEAKNPRLPNDAKVYGKALYEAAAPEATK